MARFGSSVQEYMYAGLGMRVPGDGGRGEWRRWVSGCARWLAIAALGVGVAEAAEKKPWLQVPLESIGFPGVSNVFLSSGASMLTVHFLDSNHLLVTFGLRKLVPRLERDPGDHEDRLVAAEIVDLPSGHVGAKTEWHLHDHGRYLWSLGGGRFLVRIGEQLYTMAPSANAGEKDPFGRTVFPGRGVKPTLVNVSADGGVVTVETVVGKPSESGGTKVVLGDQDTAPASNMTTLIDFFRLQVDSDGLFEMAKAGEVLSPSPIMLPVDGDGYLWAEDAGGGGWKVTFNGYGGKVAELGVVRSSCRPRLQMTSRSEYIALTCQGSDDRIQMSSFGLDGHETWEETVGDFGRPMFAFSPVAGRFAVSGSGSGDVAAVAPGEPNAAPRQEVRVYQNVSGDMLLRVECTPMFKTAENFDLSPDGMLAAVVRGGAISIYKLPGLSKKDQSDMAEVRAFAPEASTGEVTLGRLVTRPAVRTARSETPASLVPVTELPVLGSSSAASPRRKPTLLNPGEKPEYGSANPERN